MKLHHPTFGEEEIAAATDVLRSTRVTQGEKVKAFERAFCEKFGFSHAIACNSGSSANLLAIAVLKSLGYLEDNDKVIVPALSWSTTVFPIIQHHLIPVFVDCDLDTLNISNVQAGHACMPMHVYGNPCALRTIRLRIDDCCEAMGAFIDGESVGSTAIMATFSTYFSHHITTLEGGIVATNDKAVADMLRIQRSHGWIRDVPDHKVDPAIDPRFTFVELGYNLRMTEVQAAIGLVQLPKLDGIIKRRREVHQQLTERLSRFPWIRLQKETPGGKSSCFGFTVIIEEDAPFPVVHVRSHLESRGIETRSIICGNMARQPVMKKYPHRCIGDLANATKVMNDGFSIGCHQDVTEEDIDRVSDAFDSIGGAE